METKRISTILLLLALWLAAGSSCSDDNPFLSNEAGSTLEVTDEHRLSSFFIERHVWNLPDTTTYITIQLRSHTDSSVQEFYATVGIKDGRLWLSIRIPANVHIPDSDYDMLAITAEGKKLDVRLIATFKNEMLHSIMSAAVEYGLEGSGTAEDPYMISSADDFSSFTYGLYKDSVNHGCRLYFKQGADFIAPPMSDSYTGRNYSGYSFAGTYDGGGHTITINYTGSSSERDRNVGMFKVLYRGATIKNLMVNAGIRGVLQNGGAVAGRTEGTVVLDGVQVSGSLNDCGDNIGGFVGQSKDTLSVNNCRIHANVNGASYVGGLVGCQASGRLVVSNFTNLEPGSETGVIGIISSGSNVGGVAGAIDNSYVILSNVTLIHSISQSDTDIKVIYSREGNAGGLVGSMSIESASTITGVQVAASVRSDGNNVGGLVGTYTADKELTVRDCEFNSYLRGNENVGGFFGTASDGTIHIEGSASQVAKVYNGGHLSIEANKNAGGLIGYLACNIKADNKCLINAPVVAYVSAAGGVAGRIKGRTLSAENFKLDANMHVYGAEAAGGIVGYAENSSITGSNDATMTTYAIPQADRFKSHFSGTVSSGSPSGGTSQTVGLSIGGIVGYAGNSSITGVGFTGSVFGKEHVGGIVGQAVLSSSNNAIKHCINNGKTVTNNSDQNTGGIVGLLSLEYGTVENLINYGRIEGAKNTGGIIGHASMVGDKVKAILKYMVNKGTITGRNDVGGCVGSIDGNGSKGNEIHRSANYGDVSNSGGGCVGGILGYGGISQSAIFSCANHGNINGGAGGNSNVGGICGRFGWHSGSAVAKEKNIELAYCCNRGTVSSDDRGSFVGGILGRQALRNSTESDPWWVHDCYNTGSLPSKHDRNTGGIVGYVDHGSKVVNCYNIGKVSHGNALVGTRKGAAVWYNSNLYFLEGTGGSWVGKKFKAADKEKESTYKGFNFSSVWYFIGSLNDGCPSLLDCRFQYAGTD